MSNGELAEVLAALSLSIAEAGRIATAVERLATAQERANQLMEESTNKINVAAIGLQQQMHNETLEHQARSMERMESKIT